MMATIPRGVAGLRAWLSMVLSAVCVTYGCRSPEPARTTVAPPPYASPVQAAAPPPPPPDVCGAPPIPAASAFARTAVEMPPPPPCPSGSATRIGGVASVVSFPGVLVSVGGPDLCVLPTTGASGRRWELFHVVPGDNLYRVAGDASGRVLATWEKDPDIHLFDPAKKQHVRFRKPGAPSPSIFEWGVSDLYFSQDGRTAVFFMEDRPGRPPTTHAGYLLDLDGSGPPTTLFVQRGLLLRSSAAAAVFAVPKNEQVACFDLGCWPIAEIRAWELTGGVVGCKTLLSGAGDQLERARALPGSDDEHQVAVLTADRSRNRGLLRWRYGAARADFRPLPPTAPGIDWAADASRFTRAGDLVELSATDTWGLLVQRHSPTGETAATRFPALPRRQGMTDPEGAHVVKERANGDLFVHWSDYILLVPAAGGQARLMNLVAVPGREWAWVDAYVPEPEALWLGVESGGGSYFYELSFAEIERSAKPWP